MIKITHKYGTRIMNGSETVRPDGHLSFRLPGSCTFDITMIQGLTFCSFRKAVLFGSPRLQQVEWNGFTIIQ